jgi:peroxiredoxin
VVEPPGDRRLGRDTSAEHLFRRGGAQEDYIGGAHLQVGADLPAFNGTDAWDLPMTGTFLVDRSGTVRLAFVDPDFTRRLDPSVILARLNELKG